MGTKERREREKTELRQRILDAALAIIGEESFAALSMRKLAERIEYSPASIYLYFKNREEIAQELSEKGFADFLAAMQTAVAGREGTAALGALSSAYMDFGLKHPEMYRLIFMGDSAYMTAAYAAEKPYTSAASSYELLLEVARQLRTDETTELSTIAETIWSMLHGIVSLRITCATFQSTAPEVLASYAAEALGRGITGGK